MTGCFEDVVYSGMIPSGKRVNCRPAITASQRLGEKNKEKSNGKTYLGNSQHDSSVDVCGIPAPTVADQLARQRGVTIHFAALGPGACGS